MGYHLYLGDEPTYTTMVYHLYLGEQFFSPFWPTYRSATYLYQFTTQSHYVVGIWVAILLLLLGI